MNKHALCTCLLCKSEVSTRQLTNHYNSKQCLSGSKYIPKFSKDIEECPFCQTKYQTHIALVQHIVRCEHNPEAPKRIKKPRRNGRPPANSKEYWTVERRQKHSQIMKQAAIDNPGSYSGGYNRGRCKQQIYNNETYDSTWEVEFAKWCDKNNIKRIKPTTPIPYEWNGDRSYYPDFYLPDFDLYIEIKGYKTDRDIAKWSAVSNLKVIEKDDLERIKNDSFKL